METLRTATWSEKRERAVNKFRCSVSNKKKTELDRMTFHGLSNRHTRVMEYCPQKKNKKKNSKETEINCIAEMTRKINSME